MIYLEDNKTDNSNSPSGLMSVSPQTIGYYSRQNEIKNASKETPLRQPHPAETSPSAESFLLNEGDT